MKALKLYLIGMLAMSLAAFAGCGNESSNEDDTDDVDITDGGDVEVGSDIGKTDFCDTSLTCAATLEAGHPEDCIANFELGTTQAGFDGVFTPTGFYTYNDKTEGGEMIPVKNNYDSEPAEKVTSCDSANQWVLHFYGGGFETWGAGLGMDWGGPLNPSCDAEGALDCWELLMADDKILQEVLEADPLCDTPEKVDCAIRGKNPKLTRDLSEYKGIGFWILRTEDAGKAGAASLIQVNFPIPDTTRFLGECSDDDDVSSNDCYNDFSTQVRLSASDDGYWVYKEILFDELMWSTYWGLQLDTLGYDKYPPEQSIGLKFQVAQGSDFDFYLDDIILLRN